jgi:hypothetical protein
VTDQAESELARSIIIFSTAYCACAINQIKYMETEF